MSKRTKCDDQWKDEIVAELSAAVLCEMVGKTSKRIGNHLKYIQHYAEKENLNPVRACLKVINEVEKVLELILKRGGGLDAVKASACSRVG